MPALLMTGPNTSSINALEPHKAPAITRPWPSRYLVPECTIKSAPMAMGRCKIGVAKQLSTTSNALPAWAMSASALMSHTSVKGLVGVSANNNRVLGRMAACHSATWVCDTKVDCTPNLANSLPINLMVEPNIEWEQMTWSPLLSKPKHMSKMADIPVEVAIQASEPSRAAKRASMLATVGLPRRA